LKLAVGKRYFPLPWGTAWSSGFTFSCTMSFYNSRPSFVMLGVSIKVAMRLSNTFFYRCITSMAWETPQVSPIRQILKEDRLFLERYVGDRRCFYLSWYNPHSSFKIRHVCFSSFQARVAYFDVSPERIQSLASCHKIWRTSCYGMCELSLRSIHTLG
jgi:hypothetical protein